MLNYRILDMLLTLLHLAIIGFNLLGWIWPKTRRLHFVVICITAACWFILGIWFGIGYCPVTDWEWHVKEKLGIYNLPNSFIKYLVDELGGQFISSSLIDVATAGCFFAAAILSVYANFFTRKKPVKLK